MKKKIVITLFAVALVAAGALAWANLRSPYDMAAPMPLDSQLRIGKLENGLTYYIRHNEQPKQRADFYIVQNVGALLENDDQNGLAHFLEHMAFNGTAHFPNGSMVSYLSSHGVEYGRNINAYTGLSETVYNLSDIPTDRAGLVDSCLLILHDWSHYLTLNDEEINRERGVILEEMRTTNDAQSRMMKQQNAVLFAGSKYAERDIIGDIEVLRTFQPETLRKFYHDWYRPDLQAIVVVGDVDVDQIEQQIKTRFSAIPAVDGPARPAFGLPDRTDVGYVCAPDKEAEGSGVSLIMYYPKTADNTHAGVRKAYVEMLYNLMLQNRVVEMLQQGNPYVVGANVGTEGLVRDYASYQISVGAKNDCEAEAFESVYGEVVRANKLGFTRGELDRYRKSVLSAIESNAKQLDKQTNKSYVRSAQGMFLSNNAAMDLDYYYKYVRWAVESISLREINDYAAKVIDKKNSVFIVNGPAEGVHHATKEELLAVMQRVEESEFEPYEETVAGEALLDAAAIIPGKIVATRPLPLLNGEEWELSNGAKVYYAKASYDAEQVELGAVSKGGSSLYEPEMLPAVSVTSQIMGAFGLGGHSGTQLQKLLAGKQVSSTVSISALRETMRFRADFADLETMFQLAYLRFTQPMFEAETFNSTMERTITAMAGERANPLRMVSDSISKINSNYSPRAVIVDAAALRKITLEDVERIYRERFSDASDFIFVLVGDVDAAVVRPLVERYLASIPSTYTHENWRDNHEQAPRGKTHREIEVPFETAKAIVSVNFLRDMSYSRQTTIPLAILKGILEQRLIRNIRERESGTYSISVDSDFERDLKQRVSIGIQFECDPYESDRLKGLVYGELETLKERGVTAAEVQDQVQALVKNRQQSLEHNVYVLSALSTYAQTGVDDTDPANFERIIERVTPAAIRELAQQIFDEQADVIDLVFHSPR